MKDFLPALSSNPSSGRNPPLHFSYHYLDKETTKQRTFHNLTKSPEVEKEYQELLDKKNQRTFIDITSEPLKIEYSNTLNYLNNGLKSVLFLSILFIVDSCLILKLLGPSELAISVIVFASLSITMILLVIINLKLKNLLDPHGYVLFYLFSMILSFVLLSLYIMKIISFIIIFRRLNAHKECRKKYKCPGYFAYLLLLIFSIILFIGVLICIKFTLVLFFDGFTILALKKKSIVQRQIELNEKNENGGKIEFEDDDSINKSTYKLDSNDNLKTE